MKIYSVSPVKYVNQVANAKHAKIKSTPVFKATMGIDEQSFYELAQKPTFFNSEPKAAAQLIETCKKFKPVIDKLDPNVHFNFKAIQPSDYLACGILNKNEIYVALTTRFHDIEPMRKQILAVKDEHLKQRQEEIDKCNDDTRKGSNRFPYEDDMWRYINSHFIKPEAFDALEKNSSVGIETLAKETNYSGCKINKKNPDLKRIEERIGWDLNCYKPFSDALEKVIDFQPLTFVTDNK